jgi:flagellar biosynthesis protein FliQ
MVFYHYAVIWILDFVNDVVDDFLMQVTAIDDFLLVVGRVIGVFSAVETAIGDFLLVVVGKVIGVFSAVETAIDDF